MLAFPLMGWNHMSSSYGFMAMQTENETCMALTKMWSLATRPIVIASRITLAPSKSKTAVSIETDHPSLSDSASRWTASRNRLAPESSWDMVLCVAQPSQNVSRSWFDTQLSSIHTFVPNGTHFLCCLQIAMASLIEVHSDHTDRTTRASCISTSVHTALSTMIIATDS